MSVSLMFLLHFDFFCDLLLNRPIAAWNLFVLYNEERRKNDIHILASYRLAVRGLGLVKAFLSPKCCFLSHFFFTSLHSFSKKFLTASLAQSRIIAKMFCKLSASLSYNDMRWQLYVVKISCSLGILKLSRTLFVSVSLFFFFVNGSC